MMVELVNGTQRDCKERWIKMSVYQCSIVGLVTGERRRSEVVRSTEGATELPSHCPFATIYLRN
jgi:hypothetical protein